MQTILGAHGVIGCELSRHLPQYSNRIRQVSRSPKQVNDSRTNYFLPTGSMPGRGLPGGWPEIRPQGVAADSKQAAVQKAVTVILHTAGLLDVWNMSRGAS